MSVKRREEIHYARKCSISSAPGVSASCEYFECAVLKQNVNWQHDAQLPAIYVCAVGLSTSHNPIKAMILWVTKDFPSITCCSRFRKHVSTSLLQLFGTTFKLQHSSTLISDTWQCTVEIKGRILWMTPSSICSHYDGKQTLIKHL